MSLGKIASFSGGSTPGAFPEEELLQVTMRGGAATAGDVLMLDLHASDAATTSALRGNSASIFANVVAPSAGAVAGTSAYTFCVALADAADDAELTVLVHGVCDAFVIKSADSVALGDQLTVSTDKNCTADGSSGDVVVAIALEAVTTPSTRTLGEVYFNGRGMCQRGA